MLQNKRKIALIAGVSVAGAVAVTYLILRFMFPWLLFGPIQLRLEVPVAIDIGQSATFKLHVENISNQTVEFSLGGNPAHTFIISNKNGTEIWNSRETLFVQESLGNQTLAPGEEVILETAINEESWNPRPDLVINEPLLKTPGTYFIQGALYRGQGDSILKSPKHLIEIR